MDLLFVNKVYNNCISALSFVSPIKLAFDIFCVLLQVRIQGIYRKRSTKVTLKTREIVQNRHPVTLRKR